MTNVNDKIPENPLDIELIYEFFEFAPRYRGRNMKIDKFNMPLDIR